MKNVGTGTKDVIGGDDARLSDTRKVRFVSVPPTMISTGSPGDMAYDNLYLYVCIGQDNWRRFAVSKW